MSSGVSWYRLDLGDALLAERDIADIQRQAGAEFERLGRPPGWSVHLVHQSGDLHCRARLFFSPAAESLARRLDARPCGPPPADDLSLLAGLE